MKLKTTLLLAGALLLRSICFSQANPLIRYLPGDISMLVNIDIAGMAAKIPGESFRQSGLYRELMKKPDMPFTRFFSEPAKTGIDLSAGIMIAISLDEKSGNSRLRIQ